MPIFRSNPPEDFSFQYLQRTFTYSDGKWTYVEDTNDLPSTARYTYTPSEAERNILDALPGYFRYFISDSDPGASGRWLLKSGGGKYLYAMDIGGAVNPADQELTVEEATITRTSRLFNDYTGYSYSALENSLAGIIGKDEEVLAALIRTVAAYFHAQDLTLLQIQQALVRWQAALDAARAESVELTLDALNTMSTPLVYVENAVINVANGQVEPPQVDGQWVKSRKWTQALWGTGHALGGFGISGIIDMYGDAVNNFYFRVPFTNEAAVDAFLAGPQTEVVFQHPDPALPSFTLPISQAVKDPATLTHVVWASSTNAGVVGGTGLFEPDVTFVDEITDLPWLYGQAGSTNPYYMIVKDATVQGDEAQLIEHCINTITLHLTKFPR